MNLGDPDVLDTIWMKAVDNCSSRSLQNLLKNDGKLSSLYTSQGVAVAELHSSAIVRKYQHQRGFGTYFSLLILQHHGSLICVAEDLESTLRINLSPVSDNRVGFKDSSVSLVMQSTENQKGDNPVPANCRTIGSSTRNCPSPLPGHVKVKQLHILGRLHGSTTTDSEAGDTKVEDPDLSEDLCDT